MSSDDRRFERRDVLKATGAAFGAATVWSGTAAAGSLCLASDTSVYEECPPVSRLGPTVKAGSEAFEACESGGTQYYYVADEDNDGYVERWKLEPC